MHPTDQMSIDLVYPFELSIISGALYHLVATYSVRKPVWSCSGSAILANPKSQIYKKKINVNYILIANETNLRTAYIVGEPIDLIKVKY